ncbi:MAG: hypothetical protein WBN75_13350 [Verrucomicrobiia bacterium]
MNHILVIPSQTDITKPRAEIERELRLAKEYWLRTVQPYIAGRKLRDIELFVAQDAYLLLMGAQRKAEDWNRIQKGRLSRLDVDLSGEEFRKPEVLFANENLKPEFLAEIAAPLMNKSEAKMTPAEAVRNAHELLMAAERYIGTLPKSLRGIEVLKADMGLAFSKVTFDEILRSNEKDSGQLPFLPTAQQKRNEGKLSLTALKKAVKVFYEKEKKNRPQLTEEQYNRETEQNAKLLQEGNIYVTGKRKSYQECYQKWQSQPDEEISYCMQKKQIELQILCLMRWERFKKLWQDQQSRTQKRKPSESQRPKKRKSKANLPHSAASSPITAGKRQK